MTPAQIAAAQTALGMSDKQLAAALGVSPVTVRRWKMSRDKSSSRTPGAATVTAIELLLRHKNPLRYA